MRFSGLPVRIDRAGLLHTPVSFLLLLSIFTARPSMLIKDLPADARPREKLLARGPGGAQRRRIAGAAAAHRPARQECAADGPGAARQLWRRGRAAAHRRRSAQMHQGPGPGQARRNRRRAGAGAPRTGRGAEGKSAVHHAASGARLPAAAAGQPAARDFRRAVPRQPAPADRARRAVSRHADADQRLSARGGDPGAGAECGQRGAGAQPPERRGRSPRAPTKC